MDNLVASAATDYGAYLGLILAVMKVAEIVSKLTPTQADDNAIAWLKKTFAFLGGYVVNK